MSDYTAPVDDILFTINTVANMPLLATLPGFEEATDDMVNAIVGEAAKFSEGVIAPLNRLGDEQGTSVVDGAVRVADGFDEAYQQVIEAGWASLSGAPEHGGQGLPVLLSAAVGETVMSANMAFSLVTMLSQGSISALRNHGSQALQAKYLPKLISGEWTGTMNLTEPQAGSDLGVVKTTATPAGDHYLINGQKIFITWGDHPMTENIIHLVLARTPDAPQGSGGLSLFIVPKFMVNDDGSIGERNDVGPISVEHKLGIHGSPTCVMSFGDTLDDKEGAVGYLVGEENKGLRAMFTMMNHARMDVGLQGVGVSERSYQQAVAYAKDRVQGGQTIFHHSDVRRMLLQMRALTEAGRAMCYTAHSQNDIAHHATDPEQQQAARERADLLTPLAKGWTTEIANEVTSLGVQVHGGMGFIEETGAAQHYRDARILAIYEGTNGIQALDLIGRKLSRDGGNMMASLLADMNATVAQLSRHQNLNVLHGKLEEAATLLRTASEWILKNATQSKLTDSVAFDYLMLSGYVTASWLLCSKAVAAQEQMNSGADNADFMQAKVDIARFFCTNVLPRIHGHWSAIQAGSDSILALKEDQF